MNSQVNSPPPSADRDPNLAFCRTLLRVVMDDIKKVTSAQERKDAWVWKLGRGQWEFHGPDGFYWYGNADNTYDARATGWQKWWDRLEDDAARMKARRLGNEQRAAKVRR